jgi:hypothetical protein
MNPDPQTRTDPASQTQTDPDPQIRSNPDPQTQTDQDPDGPRPARMMIISSFEHLGRWAPFFRGVRRIHIDHACFHIRPRH